MQAFVPVEDILLDAMPAGVLQLVPYQVGMLCSGWQDVVIESADPDAQESPGSEPN